MDGRVRKGQYGSSIPRRALLSTGAKFNYPPFSPPPKHHFDPDYQYTVSDLYLEPDSNGDPSGLTFETNDTQIIRAGAGNITLWIRNTAFRLSEGAGVAATSFNSATGHNISVPDLDWEVGDKVRVSLVYTRTLPSAPQNVRVTAPQGEDGTLAVSWAAPSGLARLPPPGRFDGRTMGGRSAYLIVARVD